MNQYYKPISFDGFAERRTSRSAASACGEEFECSFEKRVFEKRSFDKTELRKRSEKEGARSNCFFYYSIFNNVKYQKTNIRKPISETNI